MILDGQLLKAGDKVFSLFRGEGTVLNATGSGAVVQFGATHVSISTASVEQNGQKVIGIAKPLVYWPKTRHSREVSAYLPIIRQLETL